MIQRKDRVGQATTVIPTPVRPTFEFGRGEKEPEMIHARAVEALTEQRDRLTELLRLIDDGRWWTGDDACRIDAEEVCLQADRIEGALNVVERLANEMAAEDGTGVGSQLAAKPGHTAQPPIHFDREDAAVPEGLGPFSPGEVGPLHDVIHESGGYEQRAWGLSGGVPKPA